MAKIKSLPALHPKFFSETLCLPCGHGPGHWDVWAVHLPERGGDWIPHCSPSAAVPAAVTDSLTTEHPRTERGCTVHMAEYRKKDQRKSSKKKFYFFRRGWGIQTASNSLVQKKSLQLVKTKHPRFLSIPILFYCIGICHVWPKYQILLLLNSTKKE